MSEPTVPPLFGNTDSISSLVQLSAKRAGVDLKWTGNGRQDLDMICLDLSNKTLLSKHLWEGLKKLMELKSARELPEDMQAQICAIVLESRAFFELSLEKRNQRAAQMQPPLVAG